MENSLDALTFQVAIPSAISSTITVLVVDVLVICLVHNCLHKIGAFLTFRQVLVKKKLVRISEMWFESFTGSTYGPTWFRYTQAVLKILVFSASIVLSLSLNGGSRTRIERISAQTILVNKPRSLQNLGLGYQRNESHRNLSQELVFTMNVGSNCVDRSPNAYEYYNFKALSPLNDTYSSFQVLPVDCLTKRRGYAHPALLPSTKIAGGKGERVNCTMTYNYVLNSVSVTGCVADVLSVECFTSPFRTTCASLLRYQRKKLIHTLAGLRDGTHVSSFELVPPHLLFGNDTLAVIVRHLAQSPYQLAMNAMLNAVHQPDTNGTVNEIRSQSVTKITKRIFWPSMAIICAVLIACSSLGLLSMVAMKCAKRNVLHLGFSHEQVARLIAMEHGKRRAMFMKLHPRSPLVTVSSDSTSMGNWPEEEVENKFKKRE